MTSGDSAPGPATPTGTPSEGPLTRLLEVQDHDTAVDQLHHRRATLPERGELADVDKRLAQLDTHTTDVNAQRDEIGARQGTLEHQIEASRARRTTLEQRLYGGTVAAARDLQAMSDEVRHLARHISELEDRELEVMEALEPLDAALQTAADERKGLEADAARLRAAIADAEAALDVDIAARVEARGVAAQGVRDELLGRYEQLRTKLGGTGAARLVGGSCSGCHLALPSMELDRLRRSPPDSVITCEQCGRILVR